ncbi:MAG: aldehyde ferredoxin oxidoreductase N-terminal domain-containing protein [Sulfolobales archaeon]
MKGYAGKILHIDLSSRRFFYEELDKGLARKYIGGKGLANYYLYRYGVWNYDPFSPDNPLIFAIGPFSGTQIPMAARAWSAFRSPLTNILGGSNVGGNLAHIMKYTGVDMVIIRGLAEKPLYLIIYEKC